MAKVWGDAVTDELGSGKLWWASLPHFVHARFYNYAYTFAFLLAAGLVARSRGARLPERYERFLSAGGSASPAELLAVVGSTSPTRRSGTTGSRSWRISSSECARGGPGAREPVEGWCDTASFPDGPAQPEELSGAGRGDAGLPECAGMSLDGGQSSYA